jgi:DNA-binding transcriptional regulator YhcF (GntR family)
MKLTLLSMADRTNEEHECWPSYERLEKDTGLNRKTVSKNIQLLIEQGFIVDTGKRKGKTGQTRVYKFTFKSSQKRNSSENGTVINSTKNGTHTSTKNGTLKASQKRYAEPPSLLNHPIEPPKESAKPEKPKSTETWNAYSRAYLERYPRSPYRCAKVNKLLCQFVDIVGKDEAPMIAAYYVQLNDQWYVKKGHDVPTLLQNAQSIANQWAAGTNQTSLDYRNQERTSNNQNVQQRIEQRINAGEL